MYDDDVTQFADKIKLQIQKFQALIGKYKNALKQHYLEDNGENTDRYKSIERQLQKLYEETFSISSQINHNIMKKTDDIQKLDTQANKLKAIVNTKNNELKLLSDSELASEPRERNMKGQMQKEYFIAAYYFLLSGVALYSIMKYFKTVKT